MEWIRPIGVVTREMLLREGGVDHVFSWFRLLVIPFCPFNMVEMNLKNTYSVEPVL